MKTTATHSIASKVGRGICRAPARRSRARRRSRCRRARSRRRSRASPGSAAASDRVRTRASGTATPLVAPSTRLERRASPRARRAHRGRSRTSTALNRNGMRHAQATNAASPKPTSSARKRPVAMKKPIGGPSCGNMPNQARSPVGAFSTASSAAPPHSPPSPTPWPKRSSTRAATGASTPDVA